jgi:hypothetical protein
LAKKYSVFHITSEFLPPATETICSGITAAQGWVLLLLFLPIKKSKREKANKFDSLSEFFSLVIKYTVPGIPISTHLIWPDKNSQGFGYDTYKISKKNFKCQRRAIKKRTPETIKKGASIFHRNVFFKLITTPTKETMAKKIGK